MQNCTLHPISNGRTNRLYIPVFLVLSFFILLCLLAGCEKKEKKGEAQPSPSPSMELVVPVKTTKAVQKPIDIKMEIVGSFEAITEVTLAPEIHGRVSGVAVRIGDPVSMGQALVQIDPTDYHLQVAQDRANLEAERARLGVDGSTNRLCKPSEAPNVKKAKAILDNSYENWQRNVRLRKEDLISEKEVKDSYRDYLTSRADYEAALQGVSEIQGSIGSREASLNISSQRVRYTTIYSPLNGSVKERKTDPGDYITEGTTALVLVEDNPLYLSVDIPQNMINRVTLGKSIVIRTDAVQGLSFHGKIVHISPVVNTDTRTVTVKATIDNPKRLLKPGMFGKVTLITGVDNYAILVPKAALFEEMGVTKIYVITKDGDALKAVQKRVTKGEDMGDQIQVKGDIHDGDMIVVSGLAQLVDGVKVKIDDSQQGKTPENVTK